MASTVLVFMAEQEQTRMLTRSEILLDRLLGCREHEWTFPIELPNRRYPEGFDSHQSCTACGLERYFDFKNMKPGPLMKGTTK